MATHTIVCVPGAWHTAEIYSRVMESLQKHGYSTRGLDLPSVGATPPHVSFDNDVLRIRQLLEQLILEDNKDVVLVSHSYSGMPVSESLEGLGKRERQAQGLRGGVTRLVFIMALVVPEGFQPTGQGQGFPEWMRVDKQRGIVEVDPEDAKKIFYNDMSAKEGSKWAGKIQHQSLGVYWSTTTFEGWRYIPSSLIIGTEDKTAITADVVDHMIKSARALQPDAFDVVERCEGGGHCLMISHPDWLVNVLRRAAGEEI